MAKNEHAPPAQAAEQRMREERDRKTQSPRGKDAPGEPRYRSGADKGMAPDGARGGDGWAETPGNDEPPRGNKRGSGAPS